MTQAVPVQQIHQNIIAPPEMFNFSNPSEFPEWRKRFERYVSISGLAEKDDGVKIDNLMYIMGGKSEKIASQFPAPAPTTLAATLEAFTLHFEPKVNVIFERFCFNTRNQETGETAEEFITSIHSMAEKCKFGELKDELIRDRIVVGVSDSSLSEKLQAKSDLTLRDAILAVKQNERVTQQSKIIRGGEKSECNEDNLVNRIQRRPQYQQPQLRSLNISNLRKRKIALIVDLTFTTGTNVQPGTQHVTTAQKKDIMGSVAVNRKRKGFATLNWRIKVSLTKKSGVRSTFFILKKNAATRKEETNIGLMFLFQI